MHQKSWNRVYFKHGKNYRICGMPGTRKLIQNLNLMRPAILGAEAINVEVNCIPDTNIMLYANYTLIQISTNKDKLNKFGN